jgi:hypothetical protein
VKRAAALSDQKNANLREKPVKLLPASGSFASGVAILALEIVIFNRKIPISKLSIAIAKPEIIIPTLEIVIPRLEITILKPGITISSFKIAIPRLGIVIPKPEILFERTRYYPSVRGLADL